MEGVLPTLGSRPLALEAGLAQARGGRGGLPVTSPQETGRLAQGEPGEGSVLKHLLPWPRSLGRVGTSLHGREGLELGKMGLSSPSPSWPNLREHFTASPDPALARHCIKYQQTGQL